MDVINYAKIKKLTSMVNVNTSDIEDLKLAKIKRYGVRFTGSNPVGERLYDAVGMVAEVGVDASQEFRSWMSNGTNWGEEI